MSLAEYEAKAPDKDIVIIKSKHLKRIVGLSASFKSYIMSTRNNKSDAQVAKKKNLRNDFFEAPSLSGSAPLQVQKRKYLVIDDDARIPSGKVRERYSRATDYDYEEEEQLRSKGRKSLDESMGGVGAERHQSRPKGRNVQSMDEDESEEEHRSPKRSVGRVSRLEEDEESDVIGAEKRGKARKPARTGYRVLQEEKELPQRTKSSWKSPITHPVQEEEESEDQEEHILTIATPFKEEQEEHVLTRPTKKGSAASKESRGTGRRDNS